MIRQRLERLWKYEYWPYWVFYFPLYFYGIYLALRSRSATYFTATNPGMLYGGVMGESKMRVLNSIPAAYLPETIYLPQGTTLLSALAKLRQAGMEFPIIAKPNIGERGKGVEKLGNQAELSAYLVQYGGDDLILQEFVEMPLELGVLYHRMPGEEKGQVSSVVLKEFLSVKGDGRTSLEGLIGQHIRASKRLPYFREKLGEDALQTVLPEGEARYLEPIGNHCRGTTFLNGNHLIDERLNEVFDRIAQQIEGYYYGRFDLKVDSWESLYACKNIKILELNGVSSEPAHVYDPGLNIFEAYRDVFWHAHRIWQISRENHRRGVPYHPLGSFLKGLKRHLFPEKPERQGEIVLSKMAS